MSVLSGKPVLMNLALANGDIVDAWKYYLEHDNNGRGVVLIGHSQGTRVLINLLRSEIEGKPAQAKLVSALLIGPPMNGSLAVPKGQAAGGTFERIPLCRSASQTGCIVSYSSFRADSPLPANSMFGRVSAPGQVAACTNPAALAGGAGQLKAYFSTSGRGLVLPFDQKAWMARPAPITTPFVGLPGLLTGECVENEHGSYLAVTIHPSPSGRRENDIPGDIVMNGTRLANWGLDVVDVNLLLGNLVDLVRQQGKAYTAKVH